MLEVKTSVTEMKNALEGLIPTGLGTAKETLFELDDMTAETSQTEKQRGKG